MEAYVSAPITRLTHHLSSRFAFLKECCVDVGVQFVVIADNPIRRPEDDALGRAPAARSFAERILTLDASEGIVVGVLGPWGSGKTSFINLARTYLKEAGVVVLDFNPWMFSGTEQLVDFFFAELAAQLKLHRGLSDLARLIEEYGEIFSGMTQFPVVGPWISVGLSMTKLFNRIARDGEHDINSRRKSVEAALAKLERPIVVVLDDIDRLSTAEIREIFKLVRLTASFPNIVYVLAFDRAQVEKALEDDSLSGRDYLEKILQLVVDLPEASPEILRRQLLTAITEAVSGIDNPGPFHEHTWPDIFEEIIRPLLRNMRDVRRYAATIHGTIKELNGQVAVADVLALEAVRLFLPDVFARLHNAVDALTTVSTYGIDPDPPHLKASIEVLIKASGAHAEIVRSMIQRLFPAAERHIGGSHYGPEWKREWLRDRRVAHEEILKLYLERILGKGLVAFADAERAFAVMADRDAFDRVLRSVEAERLEDVISSLEAFEGRFRKEHVVPGAIVLLNLLPELPERPRGIFDFDARLVVSRVVYRLLRSLADPTAIEAAVREIMPELTSLSAKLQLIDIVGYRKGVGHGLVPEEAAAELERVWRSEVRSASASELKRERDLLRVLLVAKKHADPDEPELEIPDVPDVTMAILRSARTEVRSMTLGSRALRRSPRLAWDALVELFGNEDVLKERINRVRAAAPEGTDELLHLVDKYLEGWRPDDLED